MKKYGGLQYTKQNVEGARNIISVLKGEIACQKLEQKTKTDHFGISERPRYFCVWVYSDIEGVIAVQQIRSCRKHV